MDINNIGLCITSIEFWGENGGNNGGMRIYWKSEIGFGTLDIYKDLDGRLKADTENMEEEPFLQKILSLVLERLIIK